MLHQIISVRENICFCPFYSNVPACGSHWQDKRNVFVGDEMLLYTRPNTTPH